MKKFIYFTLFLLLYSIHFYLFGNELDIISFLKNSDIAESEKIKWLDENKLSKNICTYSEAKEIQKLILDASPSLAIEMYSFLYYQGYETTNISDLLFHKIETLLLDNKNVPASQIAPVFIKFFSFLSKIDKISYAKYLESISKAFFKRIEEDNKFLETILDKDDDYYDYIYLELGKGIQLNSSIESEYASLVEGSNAYTILEKILSYQNELQVRRTKEVFYRLLLVLSEKDNYYKQYGFIKLYGKYLLKDVNLSDLELLDKYKNSPCEEIFKLVGTILKDINNRSDHKKLSQKSYLDKISWSDLKEEEALAYFSELLEELKHEEIVDFLRKKEIPPRIRVLFCKNYYYFNHIEGKVDEPMWDIFQYLFDDPSTREDFLVFLLTPLSGIQHRIQISQSLQNKMLDLLLNHKDYDANQSIILNTVLAFAQLSLPSPKQVAEAILKAFEAYPDNIIFRKACIFALNRITKVNNESTDLNFWRRAVSEMPDDPQW